MELQRPTKLQDLDTNHSDFEGLMDWALFKWEFACLYNAPLGHRMVSHDHPVRSGVDHPLWIGRYTVEYTGPGWYGLIDSLDVARERRASNLPQTPLDYILGQEELEDAVWKAFDKRWLWQEI